MHSIIIGFQVPNVMGRIMLLVVKVVSEHVKPDVVSSEKHSFSSSFVVESFGLV